MQNGSSHGFDASASRPDATNRQVVAQYHSGDELLTLNGSASTKTIVMGFFGTDKMKVSAVSKVRVRSNVGACVIALDPKAPTGFSASGAGTVNIPNCGIYVLSNAKAAIKQTGSGWIKAKAISVVGNADAGNYSPMPKTQQPVIADPLADIPEPTVPGGCTYNNMTFSTAVTLPGGSVYCGKTFFNSDVTFGAGIHYFKAAQVSTANNITISGTDVMLYFDDKSTWDSSGSGDVQLSAPQSGTYAGIVMFGTRSGKLSTFKLTGDKNYFVGGTMYLPTVNLQLYGTVDLSVTSKSGYVIAATFLYQGNSSFTFDSFGGVVPMGLGKSDPVLAW